MGTLALLFMAIIIFVYEKVESIEFDRGIKINWSEDDWDRKILDDLED